MKKLIVMYPFSTGARLLVHAEEHPRETDRYGFPKLINHEYTFSFEDEKEERKIPGYMVAPLLKADGFFDIPEGGDCPLTASGTINC